MFKYQYTSIHVGAELRPNDRFKCLKSPPPLAFKSILIKYIQYKICLSFQLVFYIPNDKFIHFSTKAFIDILSVYFFHFQNKKKIETYRPNFNFLNKLLLISSNVFGVFKNLFYSKMLRIKIRIMMDLQC